MKTTRWLPLALLIGLLVPAAIRAGLYDDEKKVTSGDIKDLDYWHAKYYHNMIQAALKSHQPEYLVYHQAEYQIEQGTGELLKKYPNHTDLKTWQTEYEDIVKKVDKNADRNVQWKPDFAYWDNEAYRQAWVNMNLAKMALDDKDWPEAKTRYSWAQENIQKILDHKDEWTKNWPDDVMKWVNDNNAEADKQLKEVKKHT